MALHVGHGWSHAAAVRHTEAASGVGAGVWVNYAFVALWATDAAWLAIAGESYRRRPRWVAWAVQGALAFVVLNAAVFFARDWWLGAALATGSGVWGCRLLTAPDSRKTAQTRQKPVAMVPPR